MIMTEVTVVNILYMHFAYYAVLKTRMTVTNSNKLEKTLVKTEGRLHIQRIPLTATKLNLSVICYDAEVYIHR